MDSDRGSGPVVEPDRIDYLNPHFMVCVSHIKFLDQSERVIFALLFFAFSKVCKPQRPGQNQNPLVIFLGADGRQSRGNG